jgi:hypothetical protein
MSISQRPTQQPASSSSQFWLRAAQSLLRQVQGHSSPMQPQTPDAYSSGAAALLAVPIVLPLPPVPVTGGQVGQAPSTQVWPGDRRVRASAVSLDIIHVNAGGVTAQAWYGAGPILL